MRPRTCCGCLSLRDGSITIGVTLLTLHTLAFLIFIGYVIHLWTLDPKDVPFGWTVGGVVLMPVQLVFNSLLVHGARRGAWRLLAAWVVFFVLEFILLMTVMTIVLVGDFSPWGRVFSVCFAVTFMVVTVVIGYWCTIVSCHAASLRKADAPGQSGQAAGGGLEL